MTEERVLRLTAGLVARVTREVADAGPQAGIAQFTEAGYDAFLDELLADRPEGPVQVFSYGSLIWKPVFEPARTLRATAPGWQRRFCMMVRRFRGTPERPGLMMQIDRGGDCEGVIQEVRQDRTWEDLSVLWRREMTNKPPSNLPRWIDVETDSGMRKALTLTANPASPLYVGTMTLDATAEILSAACGHWGSGADYLRQTVLSLEANGIHDPYLWDLQEKVAELIEKRG